jgi:hypothetical protein
MNKWRSVERVEKGKFRAMRAALCTVSTPVFSRKISTNSPIHQFTNSPTCLWFRRGSSTQPPWRSSCQFRTAQLRDAATAASSQLQLTSRLRRRRATSSPQACIWVLFCQLGTREQGQRPDDLEIDWHQDRQLSVCHCESLHRVASALGLQVCRSWTTVNSDFGCCLVHLGSSLI